MERRRHLRPVALAVAAATALVVLLIARAGSAPPADGGAGEVAETGDPVRSSPGTDPAGSRDGSGETFPRSPDGAVAAATAYGLALDGPEVFDIEHRGRVLDAVASTASRDALEATFEEGLDLVSAHLGLDATALEDPGFVWRVVPGGWQLREFDRDAATVAVWAAVVVMADDVPLVEPGWRTTEVSLTWETGRWRLVGFRTEPGPTPASAVGAGAGADGGEPVGRRINAFAPYEHWPQQAEPETG